MTIFDYIKDIAVTKKGNLPLNEYVPFLVNRWLSFINPEVSIFINSSCNKQIFLEDKELHYRTLLCIFPKMKSLPRLSYIKKIKEEKQDSNLKIKILAQNLEISEREAAFILDQ